MYSLRGLSTDRRQFVLRSRAVWQAPRAVRFRFADRQSQIQWRQSESASLRIIYPRREWRRSVNPLQLRQCRPHHAGERTCSRTPYEIRQQLRYEICRNLDQILMRIAFTCYARHVKYTVIYECSMKAADVLWSVLKRWWRFVPGW